MAYSQQTWADFDPTKPVTAARMSYIEAGIAATATVADGASNASNIASGTLAAARLPDLSATYALRPWVNVKDAAYGALGDGAADDTAAINAAIAALPAGGVLYFPPGRYITSGGHTLSAACMVIGHGRNQTYNSSAQLYLKNSANADMLTLAATGITIRDLAIYGNKANQSGGARGVVMSLASATNYFLLDNVWVDSCNGDGIVLQGPASTLSGTIVKCESRLNNGYGLNVTGTSTDVIVADTYIDQNVQSGVMSTCGDLSMTSCHIWGNGTGGSGNRDGITLQSATGNRFVNCYIESQTNGRGIRTVTGTNRGHQIIGCDIYNNGTNGIYLFSADHCVISGNIVRKNNYSGAAGQNGAGIVLDTCTAINTTGNVLFDTTTLRQTYGYYEVTNTNTDCRFENNISRAADHTTGGVLFGTNTKVDLGDAFRYKTSDQSVTSSTALVDDADLQFAVAAGEVWELSGTLFVDGSQAGDFGVRITTPASPTGYWRSTGPNGSASSTTATSILPTAQLFNTTPTVGMLGAGVIVPVQITGLLVNTTAGTVKIQWAQGTSDATATIVKAGSYLRAKRVGG
jgi:parallel beta-helix repeat protein